MRILLRLLRVLLRILLWVLLLWVLLLRVLLLLLLVRRRPAAQDARERADDVAEDAHGSRAVIFYNRRVSRAKKRKKR